MVLVQTRCQGALCCPEHCSACQVPGRGLRTVQMEGVLCCPPWRGDPYTSYPIHLRLLFTRWSLRKAPLSPRLETWKNLCWPQSPWPHRKASTQANCSDTSTRQAGGRMVKATGSGIRLPSWSLTPKIGDRNPGQHGLVTVQCNEIVHMKSQVCSRYSMNIQPLCFQAFGTPA